MIGNTLSKLPLNCGITKLIQQSFVKIPIRHGYRLRGKPFGVASSLEDRLKSEEEKRKKFEEEKKPVEIGFPAARLSRSEESKLRFELRSKLKENPELERKARKLDLNVDVDKVKQDWLESDGQFQVKSIASHYGIYEHLFGYAYFIPRITLDIKYAVSEDEYAPVYYGNTLKPTHAKNQPEVKFDANKKLVKNQVDGDTLWTLVLTNPDGHFKENDKEYLHWMVSNIPNGDVSAGETIAPYIQPFPPKGTGFHRHVFILYKQEKKIDFSSYQVNKVNDLDKRTFKTYDFYRKYQDDITPAGLAFFQSDWDTNLTEFYHKVLEINEPVFEYDFPRPYHTPERYFALRQAFNLYLDRYRDTKQINKEFLVRELAKTDPFDGPEPRPRFPGAHSFTNTPSWLVNEKKKSRLDQGRINELREEYR